MRSLKMRASDIRLRENPRANMSEDGIKRLMRSIRRVGLICPLIVTSPRGEPPQRELLDGYRRYECLRRLGRLEDQVNVIEVDKDHEAVQLAVEGGVRAHSAYDRMCHYEKLKTAGWSIVDISAVSTKSTTYIGHGLKALEILAMTNLARDKFSMIVGGLNNGIPISEITQAIANGVIKNTREFNSANLVRDYFKQWYTGKDRRTFGELVEIAARREAKRKAKRVAKGERGPDETPPAES
jgi:hypothetical protein